MSDPIRINGNVFSWGSISCKIDTEPYYGFTAIEYGDGLEVAYAYGMQRAHKPIAQTAGKYTPEAVKLKGPVHTVDALRKALAAKSSTGTSTANVRFQIVVQFIEADLDAVTVEINGCRLTKNTSSFEETAEGMTEEIEIMPMEIRRNGIVAYDDSEASA